MLPSIYDEYSLSARVRPALLALLSPTIFLYIGFPQLYSLLAGAISIFVVFGLVTALAHFSRTQGKTAEKKLIGAWGGKPSTILLRHSDDHIDPTTKCRYHDFLSNSIEGWCAPTEESEMTDPQTADQMYDSAVRWLLEYTRDRKKFSLLFKENCSYGFRRNCYGIKRFSVLLALVPAIVIIVGPHIQDTAIASASDILKMVSIGFSVLLFVWWAFVVRSGWVRDAANSYAERLLASCEKDIRTHQSH